MSSEHGGGFGGVMRKCIYCCNDKHDSEFTLEHVIPQFLGGAQAPDFLKTRDVCKGCNNDLGLFVDAAFEKNWAVSNWLQAAAAAYYDKSQPVGIPLICMGPCDLTPPDMPDDHICELWLGPLGEQVFWVRPQDARMKTYVGGNPRTAKKFNTRAYFLFSERSHLEIQKTWLCFEQAFRGRKVRKIVCAQVEGADPKSIGFEEPDELDRARVDYFLKCSVGKPTRKMEISFDFKFDQRFMCKLAIGVAYCLFGSKILETEYSKELYKGLWYRGEGEMPKVSGVGIFGGDINESYTQLLGFPNSVVVSIIEVDRNVAVNLNICGKMNATIFCAVANDLNDSDLAGIGLGQMIFLVRALNFGKQVDLPSFMAYHLGLMELADLDEILKKGRRASLPLEGPLEEPS